MDLSTVQSGDLLFCSGGDLFGRLIRLYTGSKWSHVGIFMRLTDEPSQLYVIESREPNGVRLVPAAFYDDYDGEVWAATVNGYDDSEMRGALLAVGLPRLGEPYDLKEIAELTLHESGEAIEHNTFICSVLVADLFAGLGLSLTTEALVAPSTVALSPRLINWRQVK